MSKTFLDKDESVLATVYETSEVVANPTLDGDEPTLDSFLLGDTKYKVGGEYQAGKGLNLRTNKFNVNDNILNLLKLVTVDENGKTILRTKTGTTTYVLATEYDPDETYYSRMKAPVDPSITKGTWIINDDTDPVDGTYTWPINGTFYFNPSGEQGTGSRIYKQSGANWLMYDFTGSVTGSNVILAYDPTNHWTATAKNIGIPNQQANFVSFLQNGCTKYSDKVLGVDGVNMEEIENLSYEYIEVVLTPETFIPNTYYIESSTYAEISVEAIINALSNN